MNFVTPKKPGVCFKDFRDAHEPPLDYFNPTINLDHVVSFFPTTLAYQHLRQPYQTENKIKYIILFTLSNNNSTDWKFETFAEMEAELKSLKEFSTSYYKA